MAKLPHLRDGTAFPEDCQGEQGWNWSQHEFHAYYAAFNDAANRDLIIYIGEVRSDPDGSGARVFQCEFGRRPFAIACDAGEDPFAMARRLNEKKQRREAV